LALSQLEVEIMKADKESEETGQVGTIETVEAEQVEMKQACAMNVFADKVDMDQSAVGIVRGERVNMQNSLALMISADHVEGDPKALFSPASALIAGGAVLIGMLGYFLWSRR
jgi:hypothetical protein